MGRVIDLGVFVSVVIGKEGKTIKSITEKSGARIKVGDKEGGSSLCTITGDDAAVAAAEAMVHEILAREQALKDATIELVVQVAPRRRRRVSLL